MMTLEIGDYSGINVESFTVSEMNMLDSIQVGKHSFTLNYDSIPNQKVMTREFHVTNCSNLQQIMIGDYSFSDYYVMELKELPQLDSIYIGESNGNNFYYTPVVEFIGDLHFVQFKCRLTIIAVN